MDISVYIGELLYEHDCVIIPGFGGFVCNYKPAEIHPVLHTISPPSKAVSFNRNLRSNDGLLLNYIATRENIPFDEAFTGVYAWVSSSTNLLKQGEKIVLNKVGRFHNDIEGNLQFFPDDSSNFLKASFGLKTITAVPILQEKQVHLQQEGNQKNKATGSGRRIWRVAASIFLLAAIASLIQLMRSGTEIKSLNLNEAGVFSFLNNITKTETLEPAPLPIEAESSETIVATETAETTTNVETSTVNSNSVPAEKYYIIVGAFARKKNIAAAESRLRQLEPNAEILIEPGAQLTRVGYYAGSNTSEAEAKLKIAHTQDGSYWLLKK